MDTQHRNGAPRTATKKEPEMLMLPARPMLPLLGIGLAILLATGAFFSGVQFGSGGSMQASLGGLFSNGSTPDESVELAEFWQVWNLLDDKFVSASSTDPLSNEERVRGAIKGLVSAYKDPYTVFLPPEDASKFEEDISGNFSGVGMEVGIHEGVVAVIAPLPDSPAEKAGILAGDLIIRIDGATTEGMSIDEAVDLIRGEEGTTVTLTILREGSAELKEIAIVRATINIPTIDTELKDGAFVIRLYSFNALAEAEMQRALREYVESGTKKLVLDLRGNPGGYLQGAVSIASYFLDTGKVVVRENFGDGSDEQLYRSTGKTLRNFAPEKMVVLVDGGSASASEILAGALQEHGVATLIGAQTFGKGSVQELVRLGRGSSLKVTVARWLTPNGTSISDGGLTPDQVVERTAEDFEAGRDPQLDAAIEFINK